MLFFQVTCFPLLGVGDFIADPAEFSSPNAHSIYVPDYIINPHPRFAALTRNIRSRRGGKVDIRVPLYRDENTPEFIAPSTSDASTPYIHMDCMAFGMGMCCLVKCIILSLRMHTFIYLFVYILYFNDIFNICMYTLFEY